MAAAGRASQWADVPTEAKIFGIQGDEIQRDIEERTSKNDTKVIPWHQRLGHMSLTSLKRLINNNSVMESRELAQHLSDAGNEDIEAPSNLKQPCVKLLKSLYGLKQSGRQWYKRYSDVLKGEGYTNTEEVPSVFFKNTAHGPSITSIYVDDTNVMGNKEAVKQTKEMLTKNFQMKDFGQVTACIGVQIEHIKDGTFIHQTVMTKKILMAINLENTSMRKIPLEVRNVEFEKDVYSKQKDTEELYPYIQSYQAYIGMLSYLANTTRPDISFSVNLLARFSNAPTWRHYSGIRQICQYLNGTMDHGLFYPRIKGQRPLIQMYSDAGYKSDSSTLISQTGYVYTLNGTAFLWRSNKQTITATSTFESELIALYEGIREFVWLKNFTNSLQQTLDLDILQTPIDVFVDNQSAVKQINQGYIRTQSNKHIDPKYYRTREFISNGDIRVHHIPGDENPADLFTKTLNVSRLRTHCDKLGLRSRQSFTQ
ncbi:DNA-directed DNA polymerase [Synchytrium endobioticum]|uniref:DNA-directed DNA polymerase n=1 Tax=Synchytrium endobioticum TaxID=286115 RepID=A0A507D1F9_9FUNG|nr:DNA-directed DNA polymerase [Synchytrium endobioticum]